MIHFFLNYFKSKRCKVYLLLKILNHKWWFIILYHHCVWKHYFCFHVGPVTISKPLIQQSPPAWLSPSLLPLAPFISHTPRFLRWSWTSFLLSLSSPFCLFSFFLSVSGVVSVAGVLLFLTATALTSMTFFSCLVRHQTPALGEATLSHRRRAVAKLCTGTARQWSRTVKGRRWERRRRRRRKKMQRQLGRKKEKRLNY